MKIKRLKKTDVVGKMDLYSREVMVFQIVDSSEVGNEEGSD